MVTLDDDDERVLDRVIVEWRLTQAQIRDRLAQRRNRPFRRSPKHK